MLLLQSISLLWGVSYVIEWRIGEQAENAVYCLLALCIVNATMFMVNKDEYAYINVYSSTDGVISICVMILVYRSTLKN